MFAGWYRTPVVWAEYAIIVSRVPQAGPRSYTRVNMSCAIDAERGEEEEAGKGVDNPATQ